MVRNRSLVYKKRSKWSKVQRKRVDILFREYPDLEKAYQLSDDLRKIYNQSINLLL
ncbi:transposase [Chryseobacterium sp. StRB126]|uniref:transposase n=1 Tax=Chryseobacterium sp. StRB126 TaxID=878220 RepID=UPI001614D899